MTLIAAPHNGADAKDPGHPLPPGTDLLYVYVAALDMPAVGDPARVWTLDEINQYLDPDSPLYGGPDLRVVPMVVHSYPDDPVAAARNAVDAVRDLGWGPFIGRIIEGDLETLDDPPYVDALAVNVANGGFRLGKYGSLSTVNLNPPVPGGTRFAAWQGTKPAGIPAGLGDAWQWASPAQVGGNWDLTIATEFVYANAGRGPRKARP